jgi:hypothetical protein
MGVFWSSAIHQCSRRTGTVRSSAATAVTSPVLGGSEPVGESTVECIATPISHTRK